MERSMPIADAGILACLLILILGVGKGLDMWFAACAVGRCVVW